jgi:hypothetical protein
MRDIDGIIVPNYNRYPAVKARKGLKPKESFFKGFLY